ncbi:hypothetical protein R1flu_001700 [Riccia fluitans]|uniref:Uncharacterized protein n=1 Tax=Riccia fluitans TaxID=41844 RepID=A0ABD1Y409_9MARC
MALNKSPLSKEGSLLEQMSFPFADLACAKALDEDREASPLAGFTAIRAFSVVVRSSGFRCSFQGQHQRILQGHITDDFALRAHHPVKSQDSLLQLTRSLQ